MAWDWRKIIQQQQQQPPTPPGQPAIPTWLQQTLPGQQQQPVTPGSYPQAPQVQLPQPTIPYPTFGPGSRSTPAPANAPAQAYSAPAPAFDFDEGRRTRAGMQPTQPTQPAAPTVQKWGTPVPVPGGGTRHTYAYRQNPYMQEGREGYTTQQTQSGLTPQMNALGYVFDGQTGTWVRAPQQAAGGAGYGGRAYGGGGGGYSSGGQRKSNWYMALTNLNFEA